MISIHIHRPSRYEKQIRNRTVYKIMASHGIKCKSCMYVCRCNAAKLSRSLYERHTGQMTGTLGKLPGKLKRWKIRVRRQLSCGVSTGGADKLPHASLGVYWLVVSCGDGELHGVRGGLRFGRWWTGLVKVHPEWSNMESWRGRPQ
jgi:hypothetical protein